MIVGLGALTQDQLNGLAPIPITDPVYGTTQLLYRDPVSGTMLPLGESISATGQYTCDTSNPASQCYNLPGSPAGWSGSGTPVPFIGGGARLPVSGDSAPPANVLTAPLPPTTPTPQQIAGGQTIAGNGALQLMGSQPVTLPSSAEVFLSSTGLLGLPNWMLIAGAFAALMLLKK